MELGQSCDREASLMDILEFLSLIDGVQSRSFCNSSAHYTMEIDRSRLQFLHSKVLVSISPPPFGAWIVLVLTSDISIYPPALEPRAVS